MGRRGRRRTAPELHSYLELWSLALNSPRGIKIEVDNPPNYGWRLLKARRELSAGQYDNLRVAFDKTHVWIVPR